MSLNQDAWCQTGAFGTVEDKEAKRTLFGSGSKVTWRKADQCMDDVDSDADTPTTRTGQVKRRSKWVVLGMRILVIAVMVQLLRTVVDMKNRLSYLMVMAIVLGSLSIFYAWKTHKARKNKCPCCNFPRQQQ